MALLRFEVVCEPKRRILVFRARRQVIGSGRGDRAGSGAPRESPATVPASRGALHPPGSDCASGELGNAAAKLAFRDAGVVFPVGNVRVLKCRYIANMCVGEVFSWICALLVWSKWIDLDGIRIGDCPVRL